MADKTALIIGVAGQECAFQVVNRTIAWTGEAVEEKGVDTRTGAEIIEIDPKDFRPHEVDFLLGDPAKARKHLGWKQTTGFEALITEMVESDLGTMMREAGRNELFSH